MKRIAIIVLIVYTLFITTAYFIERGKRIRLQISAGQMVEMIDANGAHLGSIASDRDGLLVVK